MPIVIPSATTDYLSFPDGTSAVGLHRVPRKTQRATRPATVLHFDGLAYPRAYFGESEDETWDVEYRSVPGSDGAQWAALRALLSAAAVLMWRDIGGDVVYCVVSDLSQAPILPLPQPVTDIRFSLTRVTYP
jgi:hypothetical protein